MLKNKLIIYHSSLTSRGALYMIARRFELVLFFAFVLWLVACNANNYGNWESSPTDFPDVLVDRSWLTGDPCSPPCWYSLTPDISSKKDVLDVMGTLPFVASADIEVSTIGYSDALTGENFAAERILIEENNGRTLRMVIGQDILKQIDFGLNFEITIAEVLEIIGVPDAVRMLPDFNSNLCEVEFHWLDKQLIVVSEVSGDNWKEKCMEIENGSTVDRNMHIMQVTIIYQNWQTAMMETNGAMKWPGFGD